MNSQQITFGEAIPILALVAAKQVGRRPVPYRWLLEHLQPTIRKGFEASGREPLSERKVREVARSLVERLEGEGVLAVERTGGQVRAVRLTPASVPRYFSKMLASLALQVARNRAAWGERNEQIQALAEKAGVDERTVWRWVSGVTNPKPVQLATLLYEVNPDVVSSKNIASETLTLFHFLQEANLTKAEAMRASAWLDRNYRHPQIELLEEMQKIRKEAEQRGKPKARAERRQPL